MIFRTLFAIGVLVTGVLGWFFAIGLQDGSITSFNIRLWIVTLAVPLVVLGGAAALKTHKRSGLASLLLLLIALPAIAIGLAMLVLALASAHWG